MNHYSGINLNDFLAQEGVLEEVLARAHKRPLAMQLQDALYELQLTTTELAARFQTRRSQVRYLLDPYSTAVRKDKDL